MQKFFNTVSRIDKIFLIVSLFAFVFLFVWQVQVSVTRFFDVDEFTYVHWVSQFAAGQRPYVDFFMFFPPIFLFFFAPVFWLMGSYVSVFIGARIIALIIAGVLFLSVSLLFGIVRKRWVYVLIPASIVAFLPMPFDKFIEIRPDNLATVCAFIGVVFHCMFLQRIQAKGTALATGAFYAASLLVFPKAISFVCIGIIVWLVDVLFGIRDNAKTIDRTNVLKLFPQLWVVIGGAVISFVVLLYLVSLGNVSHVFYSLTSLALETNKTYGYIMEPHLFFFPNAAFYGGDGLTAGLLLNHFFWIVGIFVGVYRLLSCVLTGEGKRGTVLQELLLAGIFFFNVWLYISFYPMKHPQYLIPIALFVAFYAADGLVLFLEKLKQYWIFAPLLFLTCLSVLLIVTSNKVNKPKLYGSNRLQLQQLSLLQKTIPSDTEVFDIEGRMVFWKQPYPICCLPFGEYMYNVSRKPKPLREVLEEKHVEYLWQGDSRRIYTLEMADRVYIQNNYEWVEGWGDTLWKRK